MPTALDATVGGANANTYLMNSAADTYFGDRLGVTAWTGASEDDQNRALLMAADRLQKENWLGDRVATTQRLAWPRTGVQKVDSVGGYDGYPMSYGWGDWYLTTEIPQPVKDAQCELALSLLANGAAPGAGSRRVKNFSADGLSVAYEYSGLAGSLPDDVLRLISGLLAGNRLVRA